MGIKKKLACLLIALVQISGVFAVSSPRVSAAGSCSATITPHQSAPLSQAVFDVTINNTGTDDIYFIRVTRPSASFNINGISQNGWTDSTSNDGTLLSDNVLPAGQSYSFQLAAFIASEPASGLFWTVEVSTSMVGSGTFGCSGDVSAAITGSPDNSSDAGYADLQVSSITNSTATISWVTDNLADGIVYYGTTSSYGSFQAQSGGQTTSHLVTLTGLAAGTTYHYVIGGQDEQGNLIQSSDQTFTTTGGGSGSNGGGSQNGGTTQPPATPPATPAPGSALEALFRSPEVRGDRTQPTIELNPMSDAAVKTAPRFSGKAADNIVLASVEYSIDNGQNWLPIKNLIGTKTFDFSFVPNVSADGNYPILVRASDGAGNRAVTPLYTLIIDTLPPAVGNVMAAVGPYVVQPDGSGNMKGSIGVGMNFSVNVIGGATNVSIEAVDTKDAKKTYRYGLSYSAETGLWQGEVKVDQAGKYELTVRSIDGGKTKRDRKFATIDIAASLRANDKGTKKPVKDVEVNVYRLNKDTKRWSRWDGSPYGQPGQARTNDAGFTGAFLPAGTYFLEAKSDDYYTKKTAIFNIGQPTIIRHDFSLQKKRRISLLVFSRTLPNFDFSNDAVAFADTVEQVNNQKTDLPQFSLPRTDGTMLKTLNIYGKPTVISFVPTWSPVAQNQLKILDSITNKEIRIIPISSGESALKLQAYASVSGLSLPIAVDVNNDLIAQFNPSGLPAHYFVDRHGVIRRVIYGLMSADEIREKIIP